MLRIFISSTHTASILQAIYAEKTKRDDSVDILILDASKTKSTLVKLIRDSEVLHKWDHVLDFSIPVNDEKNIKPSVTKKITRRVKHWPGVKQVYNALLKNYQAKKDEEEFSKLRSAIEKLDLKETEVELNFHTKMALSGYLVKLFPKARINYFEHGLGDYMYYAEQDVVPGDFYCMFAAEFRSYLEKQDHPFKNRIYGYLDKADFSKAVEKLIAAEKIRLNLDAITKHNKKIVFIVLEAVEIYNVTADFWTDFLELCLLEVKDYSNYKFVIKPHHLQSFDALEVVKKFMADRKIDYVLFDEHHSMNLGAEVSFAFFHSRVSYVFSLFSSALYFISKLYESDQIEFYHGYDLFREYTLKSPKQFKDHYDHLKPLIENVFSVNCKEISEKK